MQDFSLAIATPSHSGNFCAEYLLSILGLQKYFHDNDILHDFLLNTGISIIDYARNLLASQFIAKTTCSHMLFVDDDMGFNVEALTKMFEWREHEVIAVMSPKKNIDWSRIKEAVLANPDIDPEKLPHLAGDYIGMFNLHDPSGMDVGHNPILVNAIGTGLMMISRRCLIDIVEKLKLPKLADSKLATDFPVYEFFKTTAADGQKVGEDYYFCNLVKQIGGMIYGCPWIPVMHVGKYTYIGDLPGIARYM